VVGMKERQATDRSAGCDLPPLRAWSHVEVGEQDGASTVAAVRRGCRAVRRTWVQARPATVGRCGDCVQSVCHHPDKLTNGDRPSHPRATPCRGVPVWRDLNGWPQTLNPTGTARQTRLRSLVGRNRASRIIDVSPINCKIVDDPCN